MQSRKILTEAVESKELVQFWDISCQTVVLISAESGSSDSARMIKPFSKHNTDSAKGRGRTTPAGTLPAEGENKAENASGHHQ